jgi:SAM-dependent methyltransferase
MKRDVTYLADLGYGSRQYRTFDRSTVVLIEFLKRKLDVKAIGRVLDLGCKQGANIYRLSQEFPEWQFVGVDADQGAIEICRRKNPNVEFHCADITQTNQMFPPLCFDLVLSSHVIGPEAFDLYSFVDAALPLPKAGLVLTSLFSEKYFEEETRPRYRENEAASAYGTDSLNRLRDYALSKNLDLTWEEIKISQDPKPEPQTLSISLLTTANGDRTEINPYVGLMPRYAVHLKNS